MVATLFDFNGVLVDDESVHLAAFREVLAPFGVTFDDATYDDRYLGFDDAGAFRAMLADAGRPVSESVVAELIEALTDLDIHPTTIDAPVASIHVESRSVRMGKQVDVDEETVPEGYVAEEAETAVSA